jgi:hypothetical protein
MQAARVRLSLRHGITMDNSGRITSRAWRVWIKLTVVAG